MPPHCDTLDGPVVKAAKKAFETGDVRFVLPWVPERAEGELKDAFEKATRARKLGKEAAEVADYWFFENAVRLHREGEGAPYMGLKPAGLDWGPVVPRAEKAIEQGDPEEVIHYLSHVLEEELTHRLHRAIEAKKYDPADVGAARRYVQAELGFVLFSHGLYAAITGKGEHDEGGAHKH
jgi:hypothetical protein